ncbi:MAG: ribonuclease D [Pseudomonadales bacterium]|nr:ribonuclease D [Pseudomonadales bacterium]
MNTEYIYIEHTSDLEQVVDACRGISAIALDTEFARFNTYYPIVGLIQIYTGELCFLIDPVAAGDISPIVDVLVDPDVIKVLHAGSEDMEVFQYALGIVPTPVYDTQLASAVLGVGFSIGYQALVEHYLGISLPKDQTRSDWLARPLSPEQLDYAALDVIHLLQVYEAQQKLLIGTEKLGWVASESAHLGQDIPTMALPEEAYLKFKGLWQLDRRQLNQLKVLCAWREVTARKENVPRNRVVDQKALMSIVRERCDSRHGYKEAGMSPRQVRRYADEMMFIQSEAKLVPEEGCPQRIERTDAPVNNRKLKLLRQVVDETAKSISVAPELLIKRRHLEKLIRSEDSQGAYHLPEELLGWRESVIGHALISALAGAGGD